MKVLADFDLTTAGGRHRARRAGYDVPKLTPGPPSIEGAERRAEITMARGLGFKLAEIGAILGVSRQAVHYMAPRQVRCACGGAHVPAAGLLCGKCRVADGKAGARMPLCRCGRSRFRLALGYGECSLCRPARRYKDSEEYRRHRKALSRAWESRVRAEGGPRLDRLRMTRNAAKTRWIAKKRAAAIGESPV